MLNQYYKKIIYLKGLVNRSWSIKIKLKLLFSHKIKVGFGPITTGEDDLAERKWRIDPIINGINQGKSQFIAGFFFTPSEMKNFDIVIIVKKFNPSFIPFITKLKQKNTLFIYDIVDSPNSEEKYSFYFASHPDFAKKMDGFILSSPLQAREVKNFTSNFALIEHPIINTAYPKKYNKKNEIHILAHGYYENCNNLKFLEPIIESISHKLNIKIWLIYHTEVVLPDTPWSKYFLWSVKNSFTLLQEADIAVSIKKLHLRHQRTKPSTKLLAFMAAGLPVVCLPTAADRLVLNPGVNGFYAYNPDDWKKILTKLVHNAKYRKQIGKAAYAEVMHKYSMSIIVDKYIACLNHTWNNSPNTKSNALP